MYQTLIFLSLYSGKTKLVDIICVLTNRFCNIDTIDDSITGSFQQIDLNRHLEDIAQNVYAFITHFLQASILNDLTSRRKWKTIVQLMQTWEEFNKMNRSQNSKYAAVKFIIKS